MVSPVIDWLRLPTMDAPLLLPSPLPPHPHPPDEFRGKSRKQVMTSSLHSIHTHHLWSVVFQSHLSPLYLKHETTKNSIKICHVML
jgi:hypothetical protein